MSTASPVRDRPASGSERAALLTVLGVTVLMSLRALWATDLGWQRAAGRWILAHGWPDGDALSWSVPGAPWIEPRWIWCASIATLWDRLGAWAVVLLSCTLLTAAFGVAVRMRLAPARWLGASVLVLLATLTASLRMFARPEAVSLLLFAVFIAMLDRDRRRPSRALWLLIPIQVLWANSHTLFLLGPALCALAALAALPVAIARRRFGTAILRPAACALATLAVSLLNPWGIASLALALTFAGQLHAGVAHAVIPELAGAASFGLDYVSNQAALALAVVLVTLAIRQPRRIDAFFALVTLMSAAAAWASIRNLPLFALASIPFGMALLPETGTRPSSPLRRWAALGMTAAAAITATLVAGGWFFAWQRDTGRVGLGVTADRYPETVARQVAALPAIEGRRPRVWGTMLESSWMLTEGVASHFDPRIEPFGEARLAEHMRALAGGGAWRELASRDHIEVAVVSLDATALIRTLAADTAAWRPFALDAVAVAFVGRTAFEPAPEPLDLDAAAARLRAVLLSADPRGPLAGAIAAAPRHRTGSALFQLGRPDLAEPFLRAAIAADPGLTATRLTRANAIEALGRADEAMVERREAFRRAPRDVDALTQLAVDLLIRGRLLEVESDLARAVERSPGHALAWAMLGEARALQGREGEAVRCLERAVALDPARAQFRGRLAVIRAGGR